jgi:hypothetical protein
VAANPKTFYSTAGRFCSACGTTLGEGKLTDECDKCRAYLRRLAKKTPRQVMTRRVQIDLYSRRIALLLPSDLPPETRASQIKLQPLSRVHSRSELKTPTKPSLRVVRSKR